MPPSISQWVRSVRSRGGGTAAAEAFGSGSGGDSSDSGQQSMRDLGSMAGWQALAAQIMDEVKPVFACLL